MKKTVVSLRDSRGITLIEIIVSIAILAIIAVPAVLMLIQSLNNADRSDWKLSAQGVAERYLEGLKYHADIETMEQQFSESFSEAITDWKWDEEDSGKTGRKITALDSKIFYIRWSVEAYEIESLGEAEQAVEAEKITVSVYKDPDGAELLSELYGVRSKLAGE